MPPAGFTGAAPAPIPTVVGFRPACTDATAFAGDAGAVPRAAATADLVAADGDCEGGVPGADESITSVVPLTPEGCSATEAPVDWTTPSSCDGNLAGTTVVVATIPVTSGPPVSPACTGAATPRGSAGRTAGETLLADAVA